MALRLIQLFTHHMAAPYYRFQGFAENYQLDHTQRKNLEGYSRPVKPIGLKWLCQCTVLLPYTVIIHQQCTAMPGP